MEISSAVLGFEICTCSCKHSATLYCGRAGLAGQRVDSNSFAGSRQEIGAPLNFRLTRRPLQRTGASPRCRYSPLVESFEASRIRPLPARRDPKDGEAMVFPSASNLTVRKPVSETSSQEDIVHGQSFTGAGHLESESGAVNDGVFPAPQDPVSVAHGSSVVAAPDNGHDTEARRSARYQPQTMSLTHGFRSAGNQAVSCAVEVAGRSVANASKLKGPTGLLMGLTVAVLGITTAIQKASGNQPQKLCTRCDGYGVECCDVCDGVGRISWEGKAHRSNICPLCFGSCLKKCPRCDGWRVKKDSSPVLQKLKTSPNKK